MLRFMDSFIQRAFVEIYCVPGLEADTLQIFFLFNPHNCEASINSDYSDEIKLLSSFHSPMTL